jgi:hypothetical protein
VEIKVPKGRELALAPGLKRVLITDYHIMVCCWDFAKYVYKTRRGSIVEGTKGCFRMMWEQLAGYNTASVKDLSASVRVIELERNL